MAFQPAQRARRARMLMLMLMVSMLPESGLAGAHNTPHPARTPSLTRAA
jgi:hypothetical protein